MRINADAVRAENLYVGGWRFRGGVVGGAGTGLEQARR